MKNNLLVITAIHFAYHILNLGLSIFIPIVFFVKYFGRRDDDYDDEGTQSNKENFDVVNNPFRLLFIPPLLIYSLFMIHLMWKVLQCISWEEPEQQEYTLKKHVKMYIIVKVLFLVFLVMLIIAYVCFGWGPEVAVSKSSIPMPLLGWIVIEIVLFAMFVIFQPNFLKRRSQEEDEL